MPRPLAIVALLALPLLGAGCVVRYDAVRPAEPLPPPADFAEVEQRLQALQGDEELVDRRDRIDAALDLLRLGRTMDPEPQQAVLRYLQRVVAIEERAVPMEAPALFEAPAGNEGHIVQPGGWLGPAIEEEDLGGVEPMPQPAPEGEDGAPPPDEALPTAPGDEPGGPGSGDDDTGDAAAGQAGTAPAGTAPAGTAMPGTAMPGTAPAGTAMPGTAMPGTAMPGPGTAPVEQARSAMQAGDPAGALAALEPCPRIGCPAEAAELWSEARDAFVHQERERAGQLFLAARSEPDATERRQRLEEARDLLAALVDRFPDAAQVDDLRRNLDTVMKELEALR